jgi:NADPH:quinone reductase-like Zn-dependent oxidoreductase
MPDKYRAVVFSEYGDPSVLRTVELDTPRPGPRQVRIAVRAAGVNPIEWKIRSGAMAGIMPVELPMIPGVDMAGVIDELGEHVNEFAIGDEVFGKATGGSYGTQALASVDRIALKPPELPWELAAGLPVAATTARHALELLELESGETVVIDGASGGVGTLAVQLANRRGVNVIGTASERNHAYLRSLGATAVTYGDGLADRIRAIARRGVSAALDAAGHGSLPTLIELTGNPQRVLTLADPAAENLGARFLLGEPDGIPGLLAEVAALAADGQINLSIARTYPLSEVADAHRESEAGHVRGKLILVPN